MEMEICVCVCVCEREREREREREIWIWIHEHTTTLSEDSGKPRCLQHVSWVSHLRMMNHSHPSMNFQILFLPNHKVTKKIHHLHQECPNCFLSKSILVCNESMMLKGMVRCSGSGKLVTVFYCLFVDAFLQVLVWDLESEDDKC